MRLALGVAQMTGASVGAVLLAVTGMSQAAVGVLLATTVLTTLSVLLFGSGRSR